MTGREAATGAARSRLTLAVACAATAMLMLDVAVVNTAVPSIARDLRASFAGIQWLVDAYTIALASMVLTAGALADRFGRRRSFGVGLALFTGMSVACCIAPSIFVLDAFRAAQGVGAAIMFATSLALIRDAYPEPGRRGGAFAAYGASIGAAFAVGPLAGGALTSWFGWRAVFFINVPVGLAALSLIKRIHDGRDRRGRPVDWPGQLLLISGLGSLVAALLRGNTAGWNSVPILAMLAVAAASLTGFVVAQRRGRHPMLPPSLFRNPSFTGAQLTAFAISASFFALFFYISIYLQDIVGLSPIRTGLSLLPATLVLFFVSALAGHLQSRVPARVLIGAGLSAVTAGLLAMLGASAGSSWTVLLPGELLAAVGAGLFNPAVSALVLRESDPDAPGLAAGVNDTARQGGIAVGIAVLGALVPDRLGVITGQAAAAASFVHGLHYAIALAAALAGLGAVAGVVLIDSADPRAGLAPWQGQTGWPQPSTADGEAIPGSPVV